MERVDDLLETGCRRSPGTAERVEVERDFSSRSRVDLRFVESAVGDDLVVSNRFPAASERLVGAEDERLREPDRSNDRVVFAGASEARLLAVGARAVLTVSRP
jgi:hypothetical protein